MDEYVNQLPGSIPEVSQSVMEAVVEDIVETTRRAWLEGEAEPQARAEQPAERKPLEHPLVRFALDPRRLTAWYARVDRMVPPQGFAFGEPCSRWRYLP